MRWGGVFSEELQHTDTAKRLNLGRGVLLLSGPLAVPTIPWVVPAKASSYAKFVHYDPIYIVCLSHGEADSM